MNSVYAVVPAAGSGRRMGAGVPKQYLRIGDDSVLDWTVDALNQHAAIERICVAVAADDRHWKGTRAASAEAVLEAAGGSERADSVLAGLHALRAVVADDDWVLVHDAARPCLRALDIERLLDARPLAPHGAVLGVPVADTVKRVDSMGRISNTIPRDRLWRAFTPQMFPYGLLVQALEQARRDNLPVTDEASAVERLGHKPRMIEGCPDNLKITQPGDLELATFYLRRQGRLELPVT